MVRSIFGSGGSRPSRPIFVRGKASGASQEVLSELLLCDELSCFFREDFLWDAFDITEHSLGLYDSSAAGDPAAASGLVADEANGVYQLKLAADNEAETFGFTGGDQRYIPANKPFYAHFRLKFSAITTAQVAVFGLGSDASATLDDVARNVWFRLQASLALLTELDDNATDTDDQPTGQTLTSGVWYNFYIVKTLEGTVYFCMSDADGQNFRTVDEINGSALDSTNLQPMILIQKSTGTTQPTIDVDLVRLAWPRA